MFLQNAKLNTTEWWNVSVVCSALYAVKDRNIPTLFAPNNLYWQVW